MNKKKKNYKTKKKFTKNRKKKLNWNKFKTFV